MPAIECVGFTDFVRGPSLFLIWTISKDKDNERCKALIDDEFRRLADQGVTEREVQKVKNLIKAQYFDRLQSGLGRAMVLAEFMLYDGDPGLANTELERYLAVTADEVRRVAREYFTNENRTLIEVMPGAPTPEGGAA